MITYLWKLKGEALAAFGDPCHAYSILQEALENASVNGERFLLWGLYASLGYLYRMVDNLSSAQEEYSAGRVVIYELAATISDENMKDCFLQSAHNMFSE